MKTLVQKRKVNSQRISSSGKMRIDKEKFNKLKQLDRIEFRQKYEVINKPLDFFLFYLFLFSLILCSIFGVGSYTSIEKSADFLYGFIVFYVTGIFLFIGFIILNITKLIISYKLNKELEEEYFKIEVKK